MLICNILGLKYDLYNITDDDIILYNKWLEYKENKNFTEADKIRSELESKGVL